MEKRKGGNGIMKKTEKKKIHDLPGMSRRDVLKMMGAGAIYTMLPKEGLGTGPSGFSLK
jgi:hypothetical protein